MTKYQVVFEPSTNSFRIKRKRDNEIHFSFLTHLEMPYEIGGYPQPQKERITYFNNVDEAKDYIYMLKCRVIKQKEFVVYEETIEEE